MFLPLGLFKVKRYPVLKYNMYSSFPIPVHILRSFVVRIDGFSNFYFSQWSFGCKTFVNWARQWKKTPYGCLHWKRHLITVFWKTSRWNMSVLTHNFYAQGSTLVSNLNLISLCLMALCSRTSLQLSGSFKFSANWND